MTPAPRTPTALLRSLERLVWLLPDHPALEVCPRVRVDELRLLLDFVAHLIAADDEMRRAMADRHGREPAALGQQPAGRHPSTGGSDATTG